MYVKTKKAPMVAALLAALWAFGAPAAAEASLPLDARASRVFKTADPFATAPQLDLPSLTEQLRAVEERRATASGCVALCELAAGIDAHPFGVAAAEPPNRSEDAWGNYRFTSELETSHNRFGFTGHYWDKEASLYYAKARYYDPFTARFTQADSFLGNIDDPPSLHRYLYGAANPTMYWDPTGYDFRLNSAKKYGIDGVAAPELSGTVTASDLEKYQRYAGKYGTRADELQAISLSTTSYTKSWGKDIAKLWASSLAGLAGGEVVLARTMAGVTGAAAQGLRAMASRVLAAGTGGGVQQGTQSALDGKGVVEVTEDAAVGFGTGVAIGTGMEVIGAGWGAYKARQMMRDAPPRVDISPDDFARQAARRVDAAKARSTSAAYASTEAPAGSMTAAELEEQAALSSKDAAITDPARLLTAPKAPPRDHHIFPREFEKFFSARGIKIHDFTVTLDEATHLRALHGRGNMGQTPGRWNPTWRQFIDDNPNATALEIYQQGGKMMSEYGLTGMRIHPYKKP